MGIAMSKFHKLKIERTFADKKLVGDKPWEWRVDDRDFCAGDLISYSVNSCPGHPLNKMIFQIIYVLKIDEKHCVFTDRRVLQPINALEMDEIAAIQDLRYMRLKGKKVSLYPITEDEADLINLFKKIIKEGAK